MTCTHCGTILIDFQDEGENRWICLSCTADAGKTITFPKETNTMRLCDLGHSVTFVNRKGAQWYCADCDFYYQESCTMKTLPTIATLANRTRFVERSHWSSYYYTFGTLCAECGWTNMHFTAHDQPDYCHNCGCVFPEHSGGCYQYQEYLEYYEAQEAKAAVEEEVRYQLFHDADDIPF